MATRPTLLTVKEAAQRLGVHENTIRRYVDRGLIRAERLPSGVRRIDRGDVDRLAGDRESETHLDELIAAAGARPAGDLSRFAQPDVWESDAEVEEFIAMTLAERSRDR